MLFIPIEKLNKNVCSTFNLFAYRSAMKGIKMKKVSEMDEMERKIRLRSEELGYKAVVMALAIWIIFEVYFALANGQRINIVPTLILTLTISVQGFSEMAMKRKMINGDDEYREPNKILWSIIGIIALLAIVLAIGTYILLVLK